MCEKFDIDDKTRFLVLYLDAKLDVQEITKIINRSRRTVGRWKAIADSGGDIRIHKKGTGRPKLITEDTENKIIQIIKANPEGSSTTKLGARFGISKTSIANLLTKRGFKYKGFEDRSSLLYNEEERGIRVDFCKKMLSDEGKLIYRTFFSDEMGIELNRVYKNKAWQTATENIRRKNAIESVKLDCWGAISAQGATSLDIYRKGMKGELYRQVIKRHKTEMEQLYDDGEFYFIQDNHATHRMNEQWIVEEQKLHLIKLPRRSPDLNIIECLWVALKERVASDGPTNEKELRASLVSNWEILTKADRLRPFFEGLHRRYVECVESGGQKLPW